MKLKTFVFWSALAGGLAFGVGSAASRLLSQPSPDPWVQARPATSLLPDLVAVALEAAGDAAPGEARVIHVGKYEVTIAHWEHCVAAGGCAHRPRKRRYQSADHPVTGVNWLDVQQYIGWLPEVTGRSFRLPKASEWDYLANDVVEQKVKKLWEDPRLAWAADYANYGLRAKKATEPVGHFSENRQGIYDLDGNVWEWTDTCWSNEGEESVHETTEQCGGSRILAGAHKTHQSEFVRHVPAGGCSIGFPPANIGFRLVLDDHQDVNAKGKLQVLRNALRFLSA